MPPLFAGVGVTDVVPGSVEGLCWNIVGIDSLDMKDI